MNNFTVRPSFAAVPAGQQRKLPSMGARHLLLVKGGKPAPIPAVRRHFPAPDSPARWTLQPAVMAAFPTMETINA